MSLRQRQLLLLVVTVLVVAFLAVFVTVRVATGPDSTPAAETESADGSVTTAEISTEEHIVYRSTSIDDSYGSVRMAALTDLATSVGTGLQCERIDAVSTGGVCLDVDRGAVASARVLLLDGDLQVRHRLRTPGIPSRARMSPSGEWAATTTFVSGHSYADGNLSTATEIYDVDTGESLGNVERWEFIYRGEPFRARDINVWGVSFLPGSAGDFVVTVQSGGRVHLAEGNLHQRRIVMGETVAECPSVSPSGQLIAFKRAVGSGQWEIWARSLSDGREWRLNESRNVDDQLAWLDEETVLYGLSRDGVATTDVWSVPADGEGTPEILVEGGWSPAVVRVQEQVTPRK